MVVNKRLAPPAITASPHEWRGRLGRWSFFKAIFACTYAGIIADLATTALGYRKVGAAYEQNPIAGFLIAHVSWPGIFVLMTVICYVAYVSCRCVYWRMPAAWATILNVVLFFIAAVRWLVVAMAVVFLAQTPGGFLGLF